MQAVGSHFDAFRFEYDMHAAVRKFSLFRWSITCTQLTSLWSPYVIGQTIIFLPCGFYLSFVFFSSPNLSGRSLDVYHTSTHDVALV